MNGLSSRVSCGNWVGGKGGGRFMECDLWLGGRGGRRGIAGLMCSVFVER